MSLLSRFKSWAITRPGKFVLTLSVILIALRIALPYIMLYYANRELAALDGYHGHIKDIDVALYRGAYTIDSIYINKLSRKGGQQSPFFRSQEVDLSIEWKSLFKGKIASELVFDRPYLKFTENSVELEDVARDTSDFRELLNDFMPIAINRCELRNGQLVYADYTAAPNIQLEATNIDMVAENLRNTYKKEELLPASLRGTAAVHGGVAVLNMRLNPLAKKTDFDMDLEVKRANMVELNPYLYNLGKFDVNKGTFSMYMESATKDGRFVGYVKPFIEDLDVLEWKGQDKEDSFFRKIWEGLVGFGGKVVENRKKENVATKVPLAGSLSTGDGIHSNTAVAVKYILRNAFIEALKPSFDNEISIKDAIIGKMGFNKDSKKELYKPTKREQRRAERKAKWEAEKKEREERKGAKK